VTYTLREESGFAVQIEAETLKEAKQAARDWAEGGDYGEIDSTIWCDVDVLDEDGECLVTVTVEIDPDAPKCVDRTTDHDWRAPHALVGGSTDNPGVWANGGGRRINEACIKCGCGKRINTWAQRPDTGEQGLTSTSYEPGAYDISAVDAG
jgi:hypothetical protein